MRSAKAFVVGLVLALVADRAGAARCSQDVINGAPTSCAFYSDALGTTYTNGIQPLYVKLTQACVNNADIIGATVTNVQYYPQTQPWFYQKKKTLTAFILEVHQNCAFGYPNHIDRNTGPWACYSRGSARNKGYKCWGVSPSGAVKLHKTKGSDVSALLSAHS
jgi:hypothetical protein